MNVMPVLISFFSYGFIQDCIRTFQEYIPNQKLLIIDNNPDDIRLCKDVRYFDHEFKGSTDKYIQAEREWLSNQKNIIIYKHESDRILSHGEAIDYGNKWCKKNGIDLYLHIESDCLIYGRKWYDDLISTITNDEMWIVSGHFFKASQSLHLTPSIWRVDKADQSFAIKKRTQEFHKGVPFFNSFSNWHLKNWDTGALFVADCTAQGKSKLIQTQDFKHLWKGSLKNHPLKELL